MATATKPKPTTEASQAQESLATTAPRKHADAGTLVKHEPPTLQRSPQASVIIRGFDDLARFAVMVEGSGFAPKGMNVQGIGVAIQFGLELGLAPMQALQSVAVINGRPGIYGDAAKALIEASGLMEKYDQWYEIDGKKLVTSGGHTRTPTAAEMEKSDCICCVLSKRTDREPMVTTFSVSDAKAAGLWKKQGPWSQYPARMLMFRARGFNLRDNFADVLRGMRTVEELNDIPLEQMTTRDPLPVGRMDLRSPANGNGASRSTAPVEQPPLESQAKPEKAPEAGGISQAEKDKLAELDAEHPPAERQVGDEPDEMPTGNALFPGEAGAAAHAERR